MSLNDPISNLLTIIRNGIQVQKETVDIPASKLIGQILEIFKGDGYIEDFRLLQDSTQGTYKV
ncbi:MAG: 30S ribosomal protein S8, partial [Candidatus Omnitrophica bacterium]|nr:30S ribosomal protein S8 [Candidatus Omnitrophota bacterium]